MRRRNLVRSFPHTTATGLRYESGDYLRMLDLLEDAMDWQRLLSLCSVAGVAVIDEQGIYDAADRDDRLLLDLKGTMSEAELQWLRLRLVGGRLNKARRGELWQHAPIGYVWRDTRYERDPDEAVQRAVATLFERFAIEPTSWAVVRWARETGFRFPSKKPDGELEWRELTMGSTLPCTSALTTRLSSLMAPERIRANTASSDRSPSPSRWPARRRTTSSAGLNGFLMKSSAPADNPSIVSCTLSRLVSYAVFADWVFFSLAGIALLVFRRTRPDAPRPYRAPLSPVLPLVFALSGFGIVANMFVSDPANALIVSAIIALGVPVYFVWRWWTARRAAP